LAGRKFGDVAAFFRISKPSVSRYAIAAARAIVEYGLTEAGAVSGMHEMPCIFRLYKA